MSRQTWKPGNMLYPLPVVLVSVADPDGKTNLITVAWTGTICSDPAMVSISVRKERYSHTLLKKSGEFVINLTTRDMAKAVDFCGVRSGRDTDKWKETGLTPVSSEKVKAQTVGESPAAIECRVEQCLEMGSHDMFLAKVLAVTVDERFMDEKGKFCLERSDPIVYSHGEYYSVGDKIGTFGYSVRKKAAPKKAAPKKAAPKKASSKKKSAGRKVRKDGK